MGVGFFFDDETSRHSVFLRSYKLTTELGHEQEVRSLYRGRRIQASGILAVRGLGLAMRTRARLSFVLEAERNQAGRNLDSPA